jgi:ATP-dependent helicase HrpB
MVVCRAIRLRAETVLRDAEFFVALDPRDQRRGRRRGATREAQVGLASAIRVEWLLELFPDSIRRERAAGFDESTQRVFGATRLWYRDLLLREDRNAALDSEEASAALATALGGRAAAVFRSDEAAARWLVRVALLARWMPEAGWPEFDDAVLAQLLAAACAGRRSLQEVVRAGLVPLLRGRLTHAQARLLDEQAPEALKVPSGQRIRLTYLAERPPILAVRLQELFGWTETPRVAGGRLPVVLHILGPNFRPVQITDDLRSFWTTTYFQVRKDLRARYPRHAWPEDPLTAIAEAKGRRRS